MSALAELLGYRFRYRLPLAVVEGRHTSASARQDCRAAARRFLNELGDDGISFGAEEDAEAAIFAVGALGGPADLVDFAALLVRAVDEINDDAGLGADTARNLRAWVKPREPVGHG